MPSFWFLMGGVIKNVVTIHSHAEMRDRAACRPETAFLYGEWGFRSLQNVGIFHYWSANTFFHLCHRMIYRYHPFQRDSWLVEICREKDRRHNGTDSDTTLFI